MGDCTNESSQYRKIAIQNSNNRLTDLDIGFNKVIFVHFSDRSLNFKWLYFCLNGQLRTNHPYWKGHISDYSELLNVMNFFLVQIPSSQYRSLN